MTTVSQTTFSQAFYQSKFAHFDSDSTEVCFQGYSSQSINIGCRVFGAKPLPEPVMTQFIDTYMQC